MVSEKNVFPSINQGNIPELDEGWWHSVMLEDGPDYENQNSGLQQLPAESINNNQVDWARVQFIFNNDQVIKLIVSGYNRGGVLVQGCGIHGFVPVSHLVDFCDSDCDEIKKERLSQYSGSLLNLKVIECQPSLERIVFSERAALTGDGSRKKIFKSLKNGEITSGTVTNITDFGVFVDLGGVEGLIHVSELSWGRVQHPHEVLNIGQRVKTVVLKVNQENSRVALSLKRLTINPWETLSEKYKPGDLVEATVTTIREFGVFARLEEGVEGLIHISSINNLTQINHIRDIFTVGQVIEAEILHFDVGRRRLGLALHNI